MANLPLTAANMKLRPGWNAWLCVDWNVLQRTFL
ncbi:hypothetical protein OESDEN_25008 [Oesophagostomum dentatum]|uniref:Uncharacterized protein n=1 Tax=Oesophagostomum dentatum TaxID=61180 RepID=A0A0B1RUQ8_OESDE|nr:hypothetical protein OESDEN_25008 [Oesophagostomum dentatum]